MQAKTVSKLVLLGVGGAAAAVLYGRARKRHRDQVTESHWTDLPGPDPRDPVQSFEEMPGFHIEAYDLDAEPIEDAEIIIEETVLDLDEPAELADKGSGGRGGL